MIKKILIVLVVLLAVLVVVIAVQPSEYAVTRSIDITAPAALVFGYVNDFHKWETWSPWAGLDPNQKTTFSGSEAGTGAVYAWEGNKRVGKGKMTITDSKANELVVIKLEFMEPFVVKADDRFTFASTGDSTTVSWTMQGSSDFTGKAWGMFTDRDEMIGKDFEKGLASLKTVAEKEQAAAAKAAAEREAAEALLPADGAEEADTAEAGNGAEENAAQPPEEKDVGAQDKGTPAAVPANP